MSKIKKTGFFSDKTETPASPESAAPKTPENNSVDAKATESKASHNNRIKMRKQLVSDVKGAVETLDKLGLKRAGAEIAALSRKAANEKFTVAVVGEFSRGKSTMINHLLGREVLPVGTLPTTALLTRISYGKEAKMIVIDKEGKQKQTLPLNMDSWNSLVADNFGQNEPEGKVAVFVPDPWLGKGGIALLDTPGAGDLENRQAKIIGQTLVGADAALICVSAPSPLSMTEISFIKQKLISTKIPFLAIVVTKLDELSVKDRDAQIDFIYKKLESKHLHIPIVIPNDDINMPSDKYKDIIGLNALRRMVDSWRLNERRSTLTEKWLATNCIAALERAKIYIEGKRKMLSLKEEERREKIEQCKAAVDELHSKWESLRIDMKDRCNTCIDKFNNRAEEITRIMTERLLHEADHQPSIRSWVEKDYSYRVKNELAAASNSLDNLVSKIVAEDVQWLNTQLHEQFKTVVKATFPGISTKDLFKTTVNDDISKMDDLKKKRLTNTLAITGVSLGAALLMMASGGLALIGTMGVGAGANFLAAKKLSKEEDKQKAQIRKLLEMEVPKAMMEAVSDSETRIKLIYSDILTAARETEAKWMEMQHELIENSSKPEDEGAEDKLNDTEAQLNALIETFKKYN